MEEGAIKSSWSPRHGEDEDTSGVYCESGVDQRSVISPHVDAESEETMSRTMVALGTRGEAEDRGDVSASVKCEALEVEEATEVLSAVEWSSSALVRDCSSGGCLSRTGTVKVECEEEEDQYVAINNSSNADKSIFALCGRVKPGAASGDGSWYAYVGESVIVDQPAEVSGYGGADLSDDCEDVRDESSNSRTIYSKAVKHELDMTSNGRVQVKVKHFKKRRHALIDDGEKRYPCCYCPMTFAYSGNRGRHERSHAGEKPYLCSFCEKAFMTRTSKESHERIHTGEKPYRCSYCDKTFTTDGNKTAHERIHTGVKPFQCSYCLKAFTNSHSKKRHELVHTGEKRYQCSYCPATFTHVSNRARHERSHVGDKPYLCSFCEKAFMTRTHKDAHERIHTGERPFQCSYCEKTFTTRRGRVEHERTHTGEKPYHCSYCSKAFANASGKARHELIHSGGKASK